MYRILAKSQMKSTPHETQHPKFPSASKAVEHGKKNIKVCAWVVVDEKDNAVTKVFRPCAN